MAVVVMGRMGNAGGGGVVSMGGGGGHTPTHTHKKTQNLRIIYGIAIRC